MRASYFPETDTLFIRLNEERIVETADLGELDLADFDVNGNVVALTIEHAKERNVVLELAVEEVSAEQVAAATVNPAAG